MNISKTTINFAKRLGFDLIVIDGDDEPPRIWLCEYMDETKEESQSEPAISFFLNSDSITFKESLAVDLDVIEEIPAAIFNERQFRNVIKYIAENSKTLLLP